MATTKDPATSIHELSRDEARDTFDAAARHYIGVSGADFLAAWKAGKYENTDRSDVLAVVILLPLVDEPVAG